MPSQHQDSRWHHLRPLLQGTNCCMTQEVQRTVNLSWFAFKHFPGFIPAEKFRMHQTSRTPTAGTPCLPHATRSTHPRADSSRTLVNDGLLVRLVTVISRRAIPLWIPALRQAGRNGKSQRCGMCIHIHFAVWRSNSQSMTPASPHGHAGTAALRNLAAESLNAAPRYHPRDIMISGHLRLVSKANEHAVERRRSRVDPKQATGSVLKKGIGNGPREAASHSFGD